MPEVSEHDFVVKEEDRPFLAGVLVSYANRLRKLVEEHGPSLSDGGAHLSRDAKKVMDIARSMNPSVMHGTYITGLEYPRKK